MGILAYPYRNKYNFYSTDQNKKKILLVFFTVLWAISFFILINETIAFAQGGISRGYATYNHLADGTFFYEDANSITAQRFQAIAASILRVVFPFMTTFGLTVIVIKMAASMIYTAVPDFFDDVHYHHRQLKQKKFASQSARGIRAYLNNLREMGIGESFVKGVLIPDIKAMAFYDACEIGEDGRPSMKTFFVNSFPKYATYIALLIMINDLTLMTLYFRVAEIGVYFVQKAAEFEYVGTINRFLNEGKNYDPGWKGAKKSTYKVIERQLLSLDKSPGTEKTTYKQAVGSRIAQFMDSDPAMKKVDWDGYRVTCNATVDSLPLTTVPNNTWQVPVSKFGVNGPDGMNYLTIRLDLENKNYWRPEAGQVRTTDPKAWSYSGSTLTLKVKEMAGVPTGNYESITVKISTGDPVGAVENPSTTKDTITWTGLTDKFNYVQVKFTINTKEGSFTKTSTFKNPNAKKDKIWNEDQKKPVIK